MCVCVYRTGPFNRAPHLCVVPIQQIIIIFIARPLNWWKRKLCECSMWRNDGGRRCLIHLNDQKHFHSGNSYWKETIQFDLDLRKSSIWIWNAFNFWMKFDVESILKCMQHIQRSPIITKRSIIIINKSRKANEQENKLFKPISLIIFVENEWSLWQTHTIWIFRGRIENKKCVYMYVCTLIEWFRSVCQLAKSDGERVREETYRVSM